MTLTKSFLKKTKEKLQNERNDLLAKYNYHHDIDTDGDETDEVQANVLIELQNQFQSRNQNKLYQIMNALNKLDNKNYGICEDCEEDIPEKRLMINPYFLTCISCSESRELESKHRKRF